MLENKYAAHSKNDKELAKRLLEKSKEAFLLSIELMNKPTIKYRSEACSIFSLQRMGAYAQILLDKEIWWKENILYR